MGRTAIIIVSYNCCYFMQKNLESIRDTVEKDSYVVFVTDNGSDDGVREYLAAQEDVVLIQNSDNRGFACGCNQGYAAAKEYEQAEGVVFDDVFLLNNDTRLCEGSLDNLRRVLYSDDSIGAVGSVSNYAGNEQQLEVFFNTPAEYVEYGSSLNMVSELSCEERVRLSGFAILIKKQVWELTGGMDEDFTPGYFEDDDLCMKIAKAGFRMLLCKNSFIYHAGSQAFSQTQDAGELLRSHHRLFYEKHGFDILKYAQPDFASLSQLPAFEEGAPAILIVGCGLCADAKYIKSVLYPEAVTFGIEPDDALRGVSGRTEAVFAGVKQLSGIVRFPAFDILIVDDELLSKMDKEEINSIYSLCKRDCQVIHKGGGSSVDLSCVKLIIWDMDDTFWKGTVTEEEVHISSEMDRLIRDLSYRGIINSISSKNDWDTVARVIAECDDLGDFFVFNNINWLAKGPQIVQKLKLMGLRAENTLFIDDNPRNLQEAVSYCPGLMTASPDIIKRLVDHVSSTPMSDPELKRLKQYDILERKTAAMEYSDESAEGFLYDSEIKAVLIHDCSAQLHRIADLVSRANQLNYTKVRDDEAALKKLFDDPAYDCGCVKVKDRFGDYGTVGFYALERSENRLVHFLFSCRTMGMGIEQAVYRYLGCPELTVIPPVAAELDRESEAPWVSFVPLDEDEDPEKRDQGNMKSILLKGPCDLDSIAGFLDLPQMVTEFNYINLKGYVTTGQNHSVHLWEMAHLGDEEIRDILSEAPFLIYGDFESEIFDKPHDVVCLSLLPDAHSGLYKNKRTGNYIVFGSRNFDLTDPANTGGYITGTMQNHGFPFSEAVIRDFSEKWEFCQATPDDMLLRNLEFIYENAAGAPTIILLLGSELPFEGENAEFAGHEPVHRHINELVRDFVKDKDRIRLVDPNVYIRSGEDYVDCCDHYSRRVYYEMAMEIMRIIRQV